MSRLYINDYLSNLNQQISTSVERLKLKSGRFNPSENTSLNNQGETSSYNYQALNGYPYHLLETSVSYQMSHYNSQQSEFQSSQYAADSYRQTSEVNKEPSVLIDFMFKNNREFDFKV